MFYYFRTAFLILMVFTLITGMAYPFAVTYIANIVFPFQSKGSIIMEKEKAVGSEIVGQKFSGKKYFHTRPSCAGEGYDPMQSGGCNLALSNNEMVFRINSDAVKIKNENKNKNKKNIPVDMITSSGSGLDPHISIASANYQISRVAAARGIPEAKVKKLVEENSEKKILEIFGAPKVNVLKLNMQLDEISVSTGKK